MKKLFKEFLQHYGGDDKLGYIFLAIGLMIGLLLGIILFPAFHGPTIHTFFDTLGFGLSLLIVPLMMLSMSLFFFLIHLPFRKVRTLTH